MVATCKCGGRPYLLRPAVPPAPQRSVARWRPVPLISPAGVEFGVLGEPPAAGFLSLGACRGWWSFRDFHPGEDSSLAVPSTHSKRGSFKCLCPSISFSSSNVEDTESQFLDMKDVNNVTSARDKDCSLKQLEGFESAIVSERLQPALSRRRQQSLEECPPRGRGQRVSWGTMEVQGFPGALEISMTSLVQEKLNKSQHIRHKSVQFENQFPSEEDARLIYINDPKKTNDKYEFTGNEICTSKYTVITFLPKNLFIQFHRVAYLYFLAIAALNQLPPLAVFGRTVSLFPLLFVLFVTAIKDGYEDWRRHRSDRKENNREAYVFQSGRFQLKKWKKIRAGEVVKIYADETIPCDVVLLGTSDPSGIAYIQTMNLDGESNLKTRYARQETASVIAKEEVLSALIRCEQPNRNIYEFTANMEFNGQKFPLGQSNIVLRGCQLKNTDWVIGVVVYAGQETKAMLNSAVSPSKRSKLEGYMNRETLWLSVFLFIMCAVVALGMGLWLERHNDQLDTLPYYRRRYITNGRNNHKTGTLTENKMEFQGASVFGKDYGNFMNSATHQLQEVTIAGAIGGRRWKLKSAITVDPELVALLHKNLAGEERIAAHEFFLTLAACNTVIPVLNRNTSHPDGEFHDELEAIDYQGESPDEQALVAAASAYGYTLIERTSGHIVVDVNGDELRLDVLGLHEFDSVRKRMSVVIRFPNNTIKVLVKGADSSMFSILRKVTEKIDERDTATSANIRYATENHLTDYSSKGLRTLVVAAKDLTDLEFMEWQSRYEEASTSLTERSTKLRQTAAFIECNLNLLGATGIEDKLQDGVPEAIESLRQAGIKVWVLTGDKQETALSIGLSCKLLTQNMQQIIINGTSEEECRRLLSDAKAKYGIKPVNLRKRCLKKKNTDNHYVGVSSNSKSSNVLIQESGEQSEKYNKGAGNVPEFYEENLTSSVGAPLALIIDGNSLLFDLATSCRVVLCCRVAPLQKAGIVDLIKSRTNDMTLAIGDGANDVSMIQMADVGVGICGQEGRQAVMASDFAMGQFRFLKRLLLVHGHWNYQRVGYLVLYNFYRNAVFVLMYVLCTAFSATSALTDWSSVFYSVIYTSIPTIVVGILDKDLSHRTLLQYPKLYGSGHRHESYNLRLFWITMIDTLWQSLVLFYVPLFTYRNSSIDIWSLGSLWTIAVVVLVNFHLAMDIQRWVLITHIATWGSIIITYACIVILDSIPIFPNYWTIYHLAKSETYWLTILLITVIALLPRFLCKVVQQLFCPSDIQIAREAEILGKLSNPLGFTAEQDSS
ncbi:hypothetical protein Taro_039382 [Colocasia esculenta]|uniref:Phospholipid-transporting ATPase n=1 Tax=Colocasia esculenta TaxID=4460 RepID=A0A843WIQ7_COLES|nr:hypothetical protein [Colocasia esculenta]